MQVKTRSNAGIQQRNIPVMEGFEAAGVQFGADTLHKMVVEIKVVHDGQTHAQHFVRFEEVPQIGAAEVAADGDVYKRQPYKQRVSGSSPLTSTTVAR